ncbi:MAG: outer membrane lipoprotein-sorting protein [Flavobacteriales bacterium]|nr:outer membrane lipoprotein-sorting protein [Flavobacteriales bacterium]
MISIIMSRKIFAVFVFVISFLSVNSFAQNKLSAKEVIIKADELTRGKTNTSTMKMEIIRPTWKRSVEMKSWGRGMDYSMTYITSPARDKGQVFMKRKTEMWNWMPSIGRMIKIPSSMMSQGWMGSDYTNDDILKESSIVHDYHHEIVAEEKVEGFDCYKIELTPNEEAAVIWGKVLMWIVKDKYIQVKSEFYDEDEDLVKSNLAYDFKMMDGRVIPTRIEIVPADEEGKKTVLYIEKMKFDVDLPESFFTQQKMKRVR